MIAILSLQFGGESHQAVLHDDGIWRCTSKPLEDYLRIACDPEQWNGPAFGTFGGMAVQKAVELNQGRVVWQRPQDNRPERVY